MTDLRISPPVAAAALGLALGAPAADASGSFDLPGTAFWGGWDRGDTGTLFAEWRQFDAFDPVTFAAEFDTVPDAGRFNTNTTIVIPNESTAFVTGSGAGGNIYSPNGIQDFDVIVTPQAAPATPLNVALQVKTQGEVLDSASVLLNGEAWDERRILHTIDLGDGPQFGGVLQWEVYVWFDYDVNSAFAFDLTAAGSSLSLDELAVDVGPAGQEPPPPPAAAPVDVPLPLPAVCLAGGLVAATGVRRGTRPRQ